MQKVLQLSKEITLVTDRLTVATNGGLDSQVGSVVGQSAERPRFDYRQRKKCWAQMEFVNIYQFWFHPMLKYACVCCIRFALIS